MKSISGVQNMKDLTIKIPQCLAPNKISKYAKKQEKKTFDEEGNKINEMAQMTELVENKILKFDVAYILKKYRKM